jgi:glycyl-tRNA synthetase beta chain
VSLADKVDSVVAGFAAGYAPTGSSDPFALRRQANGIIQVILENNLSLDLKEVANRAIEVLDIQWSKPREEVQVKVLDFFAERLRYYFESVRGFRYDTVRAVVAAGAEQPADAQARAEAMEALRGGEDFEALSAAAKRIRNILAKSATQSDWSPGEVDENILAEAEERDLYSEYKSTVSQESKRSWRGLTDDEVGRPIIRAKKNPQATISSARETHAQAAANNYRDQLERISTLRPAVDRFFDKVLVMAEDREVRQNRLRLLKKLDELFSGIAHFAEIAQKQ